MEQSFPCTVTVLQDEDAMDALSAAAAHQASAAVQTKVAPSYPARALVLENGRYHAVKGGE